MDITLFRTNFPEFSDSATYTDATVTFWATLAESMLVTDIWGDTKVTAVQLYVAHEITLAAQSMKAAGNGGIPGQNAGIANSKTVGSASVGYDSSTTTEKNAGWWNLTNYGKQLYRLMQIFGAGCIQL